MRMPLTGHEKVQQQAVYAQERAEMHYVCVQPCMQCSGKVRDAIFDTESATLKNVKAELASATEATQEALYLMAYHDTYTEVTNISSNMRKYMRKSVLP